ncbi:MAG: LuxR C-terminal-related transcriptional regulator [Verrucomicrobiia bacterium]
MQVLCEERGNGGRLQAAVAEVSVGVVEDECLLGLGIATFLRRRCEIRVIPVEWACLAGSQVPGIARNGEPLPVLVAALPRESRSSRQWARVLPRVTRAWRVLMLVDYTQLTEVPRLMKAGVLGLLETLCSPKELLHAIDALRAGEVVLARPIARRIAPGLEKRAEEPASPGVLSMREKSVLLLLAGGCSNKQIAVKLKISPRTAETHRASLMRKLDIHSIAGLVAYALQHGMCRVSDGD